MNFCTNQIGNSCYCIVKRRGRSIRFNNRGGLFMSKEVGVTGTKYRSAKLWEMIMAPACAGNNICMYMCMVYASYAGSEGYGIANRCRQTIRPNVMQQQNSYIRQKHKV